MNDDAEIQLAAALQGIPLEQAALMRRAQRAQGLMGAPTPQGQAVGRVYRASSPLEHLATALSRYQGGREAREVDRGFGDLATRAGQARLAQARAAQAEKLEPAPTEWGAPPGVRRSEAVAAGLLKSPKAAPTNLGRLMAERDALPLGDPRRDAYDQAIQRETTHAPSSHEKPFYSFLPTAEGYVVGNARTGQATSVVIDGRPVVPASADPTLQGRIAHEKAGGKATGEDTAKAQVDLPRATAQASELLRLTDELVSHPGFKQAVGTSSALGIQKIPGTDARDFVIRLDQIRGKQFLEAFNSLKGGGQITEAEGKKATEAIARMDIAASEAEFVAAVRDFQDVVRAGLERTRSRAAPGGTDAGPRRRRYNPQTGTLE